MKGNNMRIKTELITDFMKKYGIKQHRLCILCNVSRRHLVNVLENKKEATCYTLYQISKLMEVSIVELIEER